MEKGAGLQSELLLARIEQQRARLAMEQQRQHRLAAEARLVALWDGPTEGTTVAYEAEPDLDDLLHTAMALQDAVDSTRQIKQLQNRAAILRAQQSLAAAEARPALTLSAGMKRFEGANSQSLLLGVSLPLPLFDRNQGTRIGLEIEARSVDHQIARERLDTKAAIRAHILELRNLVERHDTLDLRLLPTAEEAYRSLQDAYEAGRLPYTQLLEAERSLNQLRFEHTGILLALHQRVINLEGLTGAIIRIDKEE
jgi:cobalt-zinc-cadmium efflux system outer membrane protein